MSILFHRQIAAAEDTEALREELVLKYGQDIDVRVTSKQAMAYDLLDPRQPARWSSTHEN